MNIKRAANCLFVRISACLLLIILFTLNTPAQNVDGNRKNEFGVWGGASPDSSTVFGIGRTKDARFGLIAARYARRFNNGDKVNLKYTFDLIPAAILNFRDFRQVETNPRPVFGYERRSIYAFGMSPLGLQINFRPRKKYQPFVETTGGLLYFKDRTPQFTGTRFNFTADIGGGLEINFKNKHALIIGYKYFHISNANRGIENPGFDNNLFYVGYSFLK